MASTSRSQAEPRICPRCSCTLAGDNDGPFCSPCKRWLQDHNPLLDPVLADRLLELLTTRPGQRVNVYRELGIEHCGRDAWVCVKNHIERFRRHGHRIIGRHDRTYEYRGWKAPRKRSCKCLRRRAQSRP